MKIILASNNKNKIKEIKNILKSDEIVTLEDINYTSEIDEIGNTLHQNALIKAQEIAKDNPDNIIMADDSGLFVEQLEGKPGVYSARFAKEDINYKKNKDLANNLKLLKIMKNKNNRKAFLKTVICIIKPGMEPAFFSGILKGEITKDLAQNNFFGYDGIFQSKLGRISDLSLEEKNTISHRKIALKKIVDSKILEN